MTAFVLVAAKAGEDEVERQKVEAYAYGTVEATLALRTTYFGGQCYVWQMPDLSAADQQADRLASGLYVGQVFSTLAGVQQKIREWKDYS